MKKIYYLLSILFFTQLISCSNNKEEIPENEFRNETDGITIKLTWTHDDGSSPSGSDLDLFVLANSTTGSQIASSEGVSNSQESVIFSPATDGSYFIRTYFYNATKSGKFNLTFTGIKTGKVYLISNLSFDRVSLSSVFKSSIVKSGTTYKIAKL